MRPDALQPIERTGLLPSLQSLPSLPPWGKSRYSFTFIREQHRLALRRLWVCQGHDQPVATRLKPRLEDGGAVSRGATPNVVCRVNQDDRGSLRLSRCVDGVLYRYKLIDLKEVAALPGEGGEFAGH